MHLVVAGRRLTLEIDRSLELLLGEADVEVEPPWHRHLVPPEPPERAAVGAADELAADVAVEECVLAVSRAGLPPPLVGREQPARVLPVEDRGRRLRLSDSDEPGLVAQRLPNRHASLSRLRELRPPARNRIVQRENAAIDQHEDAERRRRLRHRVRVHE